MKVKDLKKFLDALPQDADDRDVAFGAKKLKGLYVVSGALESHFHEGEAPDGITKDFILLWNGPKP
ncbi:MAG: hypothetical protein IKH17_08590 [Bacteroidales bacterium]|nr:hypothetical protein [Bacteroidales bacterium]MBR3097921.1 hypothetical protein [Bacteroidales bacterium]MBR6883785.1 hypothetical protein [Bacteroidales bacterium]